MPSYEYAWPVQMSRTVEETAARMQQGGHDLAKYLLYGITDHRIEENFVDLLEHAPETSTAAITEHPPQYNQYNEPADLVVSVGLVAVLIGGLYVARKHKRQQNSA